MKIKSSRNAEIVMSFTDICKSCPSPDFFNVTNMSFNAIRENKTLTKISGFADVFVPCFAMQYLQARLRMECSSLNSDLRRKKHCT